jgi:hypothetical protein
MSAAFDLGESFFGSLAEAAEHAKRTVLSREKTHAKRTVPKSPAKKLPHSCGSPKLKKINPGMSSALPD